MTTHTVPPLLLALERETELMRAPGAWDPEPAFAALAAFDDPLSAIVALNAWRGAAPRGTAALIGRITPAWAARLGRILCCWSLQLVVPGPLRTAVDEALALAWPTLSPAERDVAALRPLVARAAGITDDDPLVVEPGWRWPVGVAFPGPRAIEGLQARLLWLGHGGGAVDGRWNARWSRALRRWQLSACREPDGEPTADEADALASETPAAP